MFKKLYNTIAELFINGEQNVFITIEYQSEDIAQSVYNSSDAKLTAWLSENYPWSSPKLLTFEKLEVKGATITQTVKGRYNLSRKLFDEAYNRYEWLAMLLSIGRENASKIVPTKLTVSFEGSFENRFTGSTGIYTGSLEYPKTVEKATD